MSYQVESFYRLFEVDAFSHLFEKVGYRLTNNETDEVVDSVRAWDILKAVEHMKESNNFTLEKVAVFQEKVINQEILLENATYKDTIKYINNLI